MADKTWTAADLKLGSLKINPRNSGEIHIERRYVFLNGVGDEMPQIKGGRLVANVNVSSLPSEVAGALQTIDVWTKNQALIQEGMGE